MELLDMGMPIKRRQTKNNFGFDNVVDVLFPIDSEGEPKKPTAAQYKKMTKKKINAVIVKKAKKKKHIVHGSRAMNIQMSPQFRRKADDYDMWAPYSGSQADQLEDELDKVAGSDMFYERDIVVSPDVLTGREKIIHQVVHRKTEKSVADYMKKPTRAPFIVLDGLRFETLAHAKKTKELILDYCEDEMFCPFDEKRIRKTKRDLNRIKRFEKSKKKKK